MKNLFVLIAVILISYSCKVSPSKKEIDKKLIEELDRMVVIDQVASSIPKGKYAMYNKESWQQFQDSVFTVNQQRLKEMFKKDGFLGYDIVGKKGSHNFWLLVQHCDSFPKFQNQVLLKMKEEVLKDNASAVNYAFLIDRVAINNGKKQVYGTQVAYNWKHCQAYPKKMIDSSNVNIRRNSIGLQPLETYLNEMSQLHFEINKSIFLSVGITQPKLYFLK